MNNMCIHENVSLDTHTLYTRVIRAHTKNFSGDYYDDDNVSRQQIIHNSLNGHVFIFVLFRETYKFFPVCRCYGRHVNFPTE